MLYEFILHLVEFSPLERGELQPSILTGAWRWQIWLHCSWPTHPGSHMGCSGEGDMRTDFTALALSPASKMGHGVAWHYLSRGTKTLLFKNEVEVHGDTPVVTCHNCGSREDNSLSTYSVRKMPRGTD